MSAIGICQNIEVILRFNYPTLAEVEHTFSPSSGQNPTLQFLSFMIAGN
ncbi:MAG: hypothetical protein M0P26_05790 [Bacteroidales bacterium]|nr:hypothetical protein [Bacteroidales bacterium]